jgi:hypothetical protein
MVSGTPGDVCGHQEIVCILLEMTCGYLEIVYGDLDMPFIYLEIVC